MNESLIIMPPIWGLAGPYPPPLPVGLITYTVNDGGYFIHFYGGIKRMNNEEIRALAEEHWEGFTGGLLEIALPNPVPKEVALKLAKYLSEKVWIHAVKHEREATDK